MPQKLTKEDLKRDEFVSLTQTVIEFVIEEKQKFFIALIALAVIGLGVATGFYVNKMYNEKAADLFSSGFRLYHPVDDTNGQQQEEKTASVEDLKNAADQFKACYSSYPRSQAAPQALYYFGLTQLRLGNPDEAIKSFVDFKEKYHDSPFLVEVTNLLGSCYMNQGKYAEAIAEYEAIQKSHQGQPAAALATLRKGICQKELENYSEAEASFQLVINTYPDSPWVAEAKDYMLLLPAKDQTAQMIEEEAPVESETPVNEETENS